MKLISKILAIVIFSSICLVSCKLPPLDSYVDPLYLDDENPDAKRQNSEESK